MKMFINKFTQGEQILNKDCKSNVNILYFFGFIWKLLLSCFPGQFSVWHAYGRRRPEPITGDCSV